MGYPDGIRIKRVVNNYFSALSEGRYEFARSCCVIDGSYYKLVDFLKKQREEIFLYYPVFTPHITKWNWVTSIDAFIDIELIIAAPTPFGMKVTETENCLIFLVKEKDGLFGNWKLK